MHVRAGRRGERENRKESERAYCAAPPVRRRDYGRSVAEEPPPLHIVVRVGNCLISICAPFERVTSALTLSGGRASGIASSPSSSSAAAVAASTIGGRMGAGGALIEPLGAAYLGGGASRCPLWQMFVHLLCSLDVRAVKIL